MTTGFFLTISVSLTDEVETAFLIHIKEPKNERGVITSPNLGACLWCQLEKAHLKG